MQLGAQAPTTTLNDETLPVNETIQGCCRLLCKVTPIGPRSMSER